MRKIKLISTILSVSLLGTMFNFTVFAEEQASDGVRTTYSENFDQRESTEGLFARATTASYLNNEQYLAYENSLTSDYGRYEADKALHLKETFKVGYGKDSSGNNLGGEKRFNINCGGNNGVHHRIDMTDQSTMTGDERYMHISFSAMQDKVPDTIGQDVGAGLDVTFNLNTKSGDRERTFLCWFSDQRQGYGWDNGMAYYQIPEYAGKWVKYDYVIDIKDNRPVDIYINGYKTSRREWMWNSPEIQGIKQIDFQIRDMNTGANEREANVYLDDINVSYSKTAPVITTYSKFGDAAKLTNVPEQYVDAQTGIVYNYGQSVAEMSDFINGSETENTKNVYLVTEKSGNHTTNTDGVTDFEKYESDSLAVRKLDDGKEVNPILYVEDGYFTYRYEVRQPLTTSIKLAVSDITETKNTISWSGQSQNCTAIEVFRDGEKIASLDASAASYEDTDLTSGTIYNYTIRELLTDHNVSEFSNSVRNIWSPENVMAEQVEQQKAVILTWEAPKLGEVTAYEIYRNGKLLTTVGADVLTYTDESSDIKVNRIYGYSVAAVFGEYTSDRTQEKSVAITLGESKYRVIYSQDFDESETTDGLFNRVPFWSFMNDNYVLSEYTLPAGVYGKADADKSLHLKETFKNTYGKKIDGSDLANTADNANIVTGGNGGVSYRVMSNDLALTGDEKYIHVSFSALQDSLPTEIDGAKGAGLDVTFDLLTTGGGTYREKEFLHSYSNGYQGFNESDRRVDYKVPMSANKWVKYDYVFNTNSETLDVYINGHRVVEKNKQAGWYPSMIGIHTLNFQVRDINTGEALRDVNVYLDDIMVTYNEAAPIISAYTSFGDAATLNGAPKKYVNSETGIIYNFGQSFNDMTKYIGEKEVYLIMETADSISSNLKFDRYESESLDSVKLNDGRTASPILYVEDGNYTYCYEIRQPQETTIRPVVSEMTENSNTISWSGQSQNCTGIEIFRDDEWLATLDAGATSYEDADLTEDVIYNYTLRELLADNNISEFSESARNICGPESFTAEQVEQQKSVKLTWEAPKLGEVTAYRVYRDGVMIAEIGADVLTYTDDSSDIKWSHTYSYSVSAVFGEYASDRTQDISVLIASGESNYRVIYIQDFDDSETTDGLFNREPFWSFMDNSYVSSEYALKSAMYGKADTDKSLHLKETFKNPYGKQTDGTTDLPELGDNTFIIAGGNGGVSHRIMSNDMMLSDDERYIHISFAAVQDAVPEEIDDEKGAALNLSLDLLTPSGNRERKFLTWYSNERQGCGYNADMSYYKVLSYANRWVKYDYVFDTQEHSLDIYLNGNKMVTRTNLDWDYPLIKGIHQLNFQVRDMDTGDTERDVNVYLDDIMVTYNEAEPVISTYSAFGDAAKLNVPAPYADSATGIIYNYGQSVTDMVGYIDGDGEKNVYLVTESAGNVVGTRKAAIDFEKYESDSLGIRTLDDGREVNPILYVEDEGFTYCYEVRQPLATAIEPVISDMTENITINWDGQSEECTGIEIFRDGEKIASLAAGAPSYTDTTVESGVAYSYKIRELLLDNNVSEFTDTLRSNGKPENFKAEQVTQELAVKLTWDSPIRGTATGYEIYRNGELLDTVGADVYEYTDESDVKVNTAYRYSVVAKFENAESVETSESEISCTITNEILYDSATKTATIKSEKDYDEKVTVIIVAYQDGKLITCDLQTVKLSGGNNTVSAEDEFDASNADEIKIMVWDSINTLKPLYNSVSFTLE